MLHSNDNTNNLLGTAARDHAHGQERLMFPTLSPLATRTTPP
jgi:hypothetical protein